MNVKRKIDAMHERFGVLPDKRCEDCANLIKGYCGNTFVRKCAAYGATHSTASDWRKKYVACGLFGKEYKGRPIIELLKCSRREEQPLDGQMEMIT